VDGYFAETGLSTGGGVALWRKAAVILLWLATSYVLAMVWADAWWQAGLCAISMGLAVAGVGFNIQHDGGHEAAGGRAGNRLAAWTLDLIGGSSFVWHTKHAIVHHSFTNVEGVDDDIDAAPFLRLAPSQRRRWYHRFQHLYAWPLFGFLPPKWALWDDFKALAKGKVGQHPLPRPRKRDLTILFAGKVLFLGWAVALPLVTGHSAGAVLAVYAVAALTAGICLSVVFQLAHCIEEADFVVPQAGNRIDASWCEHQLATTADFAPRNRFLTWYLGGLNFQVEHHLFPRISHVHYPALAPIVAEVCREHGVRHRTHERFWPAVASHVRHLRKLGRS
jgi:linoleoyl-CoA desaturase